MKAALKWRLLRRNAARRFQQAIGWLNFSTADSSVNLGTIL